MTPGRAVVAPDHMIIQLMLDAQANHKSWMHDSWEQLNGEVVEREVSNAYKVLYKTGKVLTQRGLEKNAENCEAIRGEVCACHVFSCSCEHVL